MIQATPLEQEVMTQLLEGNGEVITILRKQYETASISKRTLTGSGFFIYFSVSEEAPRLPRDLPLRFGDIVATIKDLQFGAGFILFVNNGTIDFLEGYSFEEQWPNVVSHYTLLRDKKLSQKKEAALQKIQEALHPDLSAQRPRDRDAPC